MTVLIIYKVKNIITLINYVNLNNQDYKAKREKIPDPPVFYAPKRARALNRISEKEISLFNSNENFVNEIRNDEENINSVIFSEYFGYQNPSFLAGYKNNQMKNKTIYSMNQLRNAVIRKEILKNENPNKIIDVV